MASSSSSSFLYYPTTDPTDDTDDTHPTPKPRALSKDRLYVGNLHPTVDEYTLLTLFSKYGTIKSLDYLFHKTGPSRGKPRGFAFVEFAEQVPAQKALSALHGKLLRGRKLVVTPAHQAPLDGTGPASFSYGGGRKKGGRAMNSGRPTTLSLLKSGRGDGPNPRDKIALMEAKLRQMGSPIPPVPVPAPSAAAPPSPETSDTDTTVSPDLESADAHAPNPSAPAPAPDIDIETHTKPDAEPTPAHPSLPPKPAPPPITSFHTPHSAHSHIPHVPHTGTNATQKRAPQVALPSLAQLQQSRLGVGAGLGLGLGGAAGKGKRKASPLAGGYAPAPTANTTTNAPVPAPPLKPASTAPATAGKEGTVTGTGGRAKAGLSGVKIVKKERG